jgi:cell wall-associated NlpC family hydrolase
MRRLLAPLLCLLAVAVAVAGCASRSDEQVHRLHSWSIPRSAFIPKVAAAPKPKAAPKAKAPATPPPAHGQTVQVAPGAPSDAEVRAELRQLYGSSAGSDPASARTVALNSGLAAAPPDAPQKVQAIVAAANQVARLPYVYGGGHGGGTEGVWVDNAYDCSGSVSFALANAGFLKSPEASGALEHFGKPGPGRWVTIYANAGHAFMEVGGARFDTVGLKQSGSRWQPAFRSISGFTARHPPGL